MRLNDNQQQVDLGSMFVSALASMEEADKAEEPLLKAELLMQSAEGLREIVERLALFGAATNVCLQSLVKNLQVPGVMGESGLLSGAGHNEALENAHKLINTIAGIGPAFAEEGEFCSRFERMTRARLMQLSGIDASDTGAVQAFADKIAKAFILTPGSSNQ